MIGTHNYIVLKQMMTFSNLLSRTNIILFGSAETTGKVRNVEYGGFNLSVQLKEPKTEFCSQNLLFAFIAIL